MNSSQLFDFILAEFDIQCDSKSKSQQLMKLNSWLLDRYSNGETVVLIIDEAQNLTYPVLEEIRLLTNLETSTEKLVQIVLSGQPELEEKLKLPQLRQLRQRIMLRCRTMPFLQEQTQEYRASSIFFVSILSLTHSQTRCVPFSLKLSRMSLANFNWTKWKPFHPAITLRLTLTSTTPKISFRTSEKLSPASASALQAATASDAISFLPRFLPR
jgi:hypothetical protein